MAGQQMIPSTKAAPQHLGHVLVLGLGKSGISVCNYLMDRLGGRVDGIAVAAGMPSEAAQAYVDSIARPGIISAFGDDAPAQLLQEAGVERFDLCIASPGIPYHHPLYTGAQEVSRELISEVEFAWSESASESTWIAITGTNGKTTTTSLCAHILQAAGLKAAAVGNIGDVCIDAVAAGGTDTYVTEISSYQLASTSAFAPRVSVVLNITPDHISWHRSFENYCQAKLKCLENLVSQPSACAVLCAVDDTVRQTVRQLKSQTPDERGFPYIPLGAAAGIDADMRAVCGAENAAFISADGMLVVAYQGVEHELARADELNIKGQHNVINALAAASVAVCLGVADEDIRQALISFEPLEHRMEPCGEVGGISFYNDSKATNVDATVAAIQTFAGQHPIILLGGDDKNTDLSGLAQLVVETCKAAICFGAAADRFTLALDRAAAQTDPDFTIREVGHLHDAFEAACAMGVPGDEVLLSPACASFDEFSSYGQRGRAFKQMVADARAGRKED